MWRRCGVVVLTVVLGGCPWVPLGEIRVVEGPAMLKAGDQIQLALFCTYLFDGTELSAGGPECENGSWGVTDPTCEPYCIIEGGDARLGTIDECGVYTAPATAPPEPLVVEGSDCGLGCADGCGASLELVFIGYPPAEPSP
jgi:hypothetical protein